MSYKGFNLMGYATLAVLVFASFIVGNWIATTLGAEQWGLIGTGFAWLVVSLFIYLIWKTKWAKRNIK